MKKLNFLFVLALLFTVVSFAPKAHALQCKAGQSLGSDECWTSVRVSDLETNVVSAGSILVYDINTGDSERGAYEVVLSTASLDSYRIAGVAQTRIATGDWGRVLIKGKGKIINFSPAASGDRIFVSSVKGKAGTTGGNGGTSSVPSADPIGWMLASNTANTTADAYISVI